MNEFTNDLFSLNWLSLLDTEVDTALNYMQIDVKIHGKQNKPCLNFYSIALVSHGCLFTRL